jgi:transcriptional regulator EpsA
MLAASQVESSVDDDHRFIRVAEESLRVRRHVQLLQWLQSDLQYFVPHDVLVAAWGDFSLGLIQYDVISALPGVRTTEFSGYDISPLIRSLFDRWVARGMEPFSITWKGGFVWEAQGREGRLQATLREMRSGLIHGIRDERGRHDCLYVALRPADFPSTAGSMLAMLLPYVDTALRQVSHLPVQHPDQPPQADESFDKGLTSREVEIMNWVKLGKTNHEIGMILDISEFTVKNHLQRIFRKLDVINRAQAVSAFAQASRSSRA